MMQFKTLPGYLIVKLAKKELAPNKVGLLVPEFEHYETDGGKLGMRPIHEEFHNHGIAQTPTSNIPMYSTVYFRDNVKLEDIEHEDIPADEKYVIVNELQVKFYILSQNALQ